MITAKHGHSVQNSECSATLLSRIKLFNDPLLGINDAVCPQEGIISKGTLILVISCVLPLEHPNQENFCLIFYILVKLAQLPTDT